MNISLIPQPKSFRIGKGCLDLPDTGTVFIADGMFRDAAEDVCTFLPDYRIVTTPSTTNVVLITRGVDFKDGGYCLKINSDGVVLNAATAEGAFYAVQTLRQIISQCGCKELPVLTIKDWPDFEVRGLYYDVSRGRIPRTERLIELVNTLSHYKINQFQLYMEHTFLFHGHPEIGKNASSITSEDILELDEFCRERFIELVPSLASFGHLQGVLGLPRYRHLAEDFGIGKYRSPDADKLPEWQRRIAWSLSPANPETYVFLDSLFEEFLPLFSSGKFNVCCDETFDLGLGQSYDLCMKKGKGRLYLDHILKLRELAAKYGKKIMFWGDIIRKYPELHRKIPKDVTLLDWGYDHNHPFKRVKDLKKAGLKFYVCPGTGSWNSLFPRLHESIACIHGFASEGIKHGATGLLNTDWGDGGHYNFMELSWPGYLFGAEQAWNVKADKRNYIERFCREHLGSSSSALVKALSELGDIAQLQVRKNRSVWQEIFFAGPDDELFGDGIKKLWISRNGVISSGQMRLDAALGRRMMRRLERIRQVFIGNSTTVKASHACIMPYWIFAVDTMIHSALKLSILGGHGKDTKANRLYLRKEMKILLKRFESLWLARNRISEINITIDKYRKVIESL
ncbi:MAG: hypothetical protein A2283_19525 [Lentisphaerae bacterium RIFOXYA12_FULL_48_11]|nr:MAG: hypothetical protein A2283_19525 [Lentisphaerae bacterium RIFOXYA12_FULL_48_11]